jgi:hypothetical protein
VIKRYFLQQYMQEQYVHGGVTNVDAEKVLLAAGIEPIFFPCHNSFSIRAKFTRLFFLLKKSREIKKGSVVFFLFPLYATMEKLFLRILLMRKITLVCYIVDIDGIKDGNARLLEKEVRFFQRLKYFIVLNAAMDRWLKQRAPAAVTSAVNFHSFLTKPVYHERIKSFEIVFAGNLAKSPFLEQLRLLKTRSPRLHFNLYGPDPSPAMMGQENVSYHGVEKPYELPGKLVGSFGLVWEGSSIEKPESSIGHYIQYITHHKLSLYIISGLPVIISATAGTAPLVEKYKIGLTVHSLYELEATINSVTEEEYLQMQVNMRPLAEKASRGEFLADAVNEIMGKL